MNIYIPLLQQTCSVNSNYNLLTRDMIVLVHPCVRINPTYKKTFTSYRKNDTGKSPVIFSYIIENSGIRGCLNILRVDIFQNVSEYDQEIPQSHTADQPTAP